MKRRGFLQLLAGTAIGAALAKVMPAAPQPVADLTYNVVTIPAMELESTVRPTLASGFECWIEDPKCPDDQIYLLNKSQWQFDPRPLISDYAPIPEPVTVYLGNLK